MLDVMARPGNLMGECPQMTTEVVPEPGLPAQAQAVAQPQEVAAPLTSAAIFLVMVIQPGADSCAAVRDLFSDLAGLLRAVGFRDPDAKLSCVVGIGSQAWDRLAGPARPAGLHVFPEIEAGSRHAVSTPGDILLHIRAARFDLCFELATHIMTRLSRAVSPVDEVHGFRYFDDRDLIGFVDGTENPTGRRAVEATIIGPEDPEFAGGSYVIVQKYLHDVSGWNALPTEEQERIVGRTKLSDIELDDAVKPTSAHNALTTITENGEEVQIVRDNMPFGTVSRGDFGTYFIGYARSPRPIEQMLTNMFVGRPPGNYDRLLDFSTAMTGTLFFVPSMPLLESLAEPAEEDPAAGEAGADSPGAGQAAPVATPSDGSLGIGSLRGVTQHE
jgi:putative iron-dependent peroxidase